MPETKRPLKVFLCHIMPVGYAHADRDPVPQGDDMRGLPEGTRLTQDGVNEFLFVFHLFFQKQFRFDLIGHKPNV
jgi:hypothetical protein